jgi:AcrR family transcriptional regulator
VKPSSRRPLRTSPAHARRPRRRRRRPEEAEAEILDAAEKLLRKLPFRDLTVDQVMAHTGLSRPSFYQYFRDLHHLVTRLVQDVGRELFPASNRWFKGKGDPITDLREAYDGIVQVWLKHGPVLRAVSDAATHDRALEQAYRGLMDGFIRSTVARINAEARRGRLLRPLDAAGTGAALIWMGERYLNEKLGRFPQENPQRVVDTLVAIWERVLYGRSKGG